MHSRTDNMVSPPSRTPRKDGDGHDDLSPLDLGQFGSCICYLDEERPVLMDERVDHDRRGGSAGREGEQRCESRPQASTRANAHMSSEKWGFDAARKARLARFELCKGNALKAGQWSAPTGADFVLSAAAERP